MATIYLGETFTWAHGIGAAFVLTGVYIGTNTKLFNRKKLAVTVANFRS
jgi:drug/metabolite transporter (DMT)-like permease